MAKITLKQIAEIAGVHPSTVDKVVHNRPGVSDEVRKKINNIMEEVNYRPNLIAKALAYQRVPLSIAVVLLKVDALKEIKSGIEKAYEEYKNFGVKIKYYVIDNLDETGQLNTISLLKNEEISGLIIQPLNSEKIKTAIDDMVKKNIPVVTVDSDIADSKRLCFVGSDTVTTGKVAGELMGQILNGDGKVAIVTGLYNLQVLIERQKAFEAVLCDRYPKIEIVDTVQTKEEELVAFKNTLNLLERVDDLKGIYITCGNVGEVAKAVKVMKKEKDIKIISFEMYPEIVEAVKQGVIDFTIGQDLVGQGYKSFKVLFENLFLQKKPKSKHIKPYIDIRSRENIEYSVDL